MNTPFQALVVEDDPFIRDTLVLQVQQIGGQVRESPDGEVALELLATGTSCDVVLLDIHLPGVSGLEVLEEIRRTKSRVQLPVILVSASNQATDIVRGLDLGANDYVTKPVDLATLTARVDAAVALKRSYDDLIVAERQRVMLESLGAACHHLAQPLTGSIAWLSEYVDQLPADRAVDREGLAEVMSGLQQAADIIHTMQDVREYRTRTYMDEMRILDFGLGNSDTTTADESSA